MTSVPKCASMSTGHLLSLLVDRNCKIALLNTRVSKCASTSMGHLLGLLVDRNCDIALLDD